MVQELDKDVRGKIEALKNRQEIQEGDTLTMFEIPFFQAPNGIFGQGLKPNELAVYLYLCRCGNQGSSIFTGYQNIARRCSMDRSTALRSVKRLCDKGWLIKTERPPAVDAEKKNYLSNVYHLVAPLVAESHHPLVAESHHPLVAESHHPSGTKTPYKEPLKKKLTQNNNKDRVDTFNQREKRKLLTPSGPGTSQNRIWANVLLKINSSVSSPNYETWFRETSCMEITEEEVIIGVRREEQAAYIETNLNGLLEKFIAEEVGHCLELRLVLIE